MSKKLIAEVIGTLDSGAVRLRGGGADGRRDRDDGHFLAFGLAIVAAAYGIGPISGAHLNPACRWGCVLAGRMSGPRFHRYAGAQLVGAVVGAGSCYLIASGKADYAGRKRAWARTVWGWLSGRIPLTSALVFEA
jgi:aquaporin Z